MGLGRFALCPVLSALCSVRAGLRPLTYMAGHAGGGKRRQMRISKLATAGTGSEFLDGSRLVFYSQK